jgi:hypothetical protein
MRVKAIRRLIPEAAPRRAGGASQPHHWRAVTDDIKRRLANAICYFKFLSSRWYSAITGLKSGRIRVKISSNRSVRTVMQEGQPTRMVGAIGHKVEGRTQGKLQLFASQAQARKDEARSSCFSRFSNARIARQPARPQRSGFPAWCGSPLALLVLLDAQRDLGLSLLQFAGLSVVLVPLIHRRCAPDIFLLPPIELAGAGAWMAVSASGETFGRHQRCARPRAS